MRNGIRKEVYLNLVKHLRCIFFPKIVKRLKAALDSGKRKYANIIIILIIYIYRISEKIITISLQV